MIKIACKKISRAVERIDELLREKSLKADVLASSSSKTLAEYLQGGVGNCTAMFLVGNVGEWARLLSESLGLTMFYDSFAENLLFQYCKLNGAEHPTQRIREEICSLPESFNHFACTYGFQCAAYGVIRKTHVYILPDDAQECESVFESYVKPNLFKKQANDVTFTLKAFGFTQSELENKLSRLNPIITCSISTENLDNTVKLTFPQKCNKQVVAENLEQIKGILGGRLYNIDCASLEQCVVNGFLAANKTIATAESMTGGLIAATLVAVPGASRTLLEGVVTYSVQAKCARLGINSHFIDAYGVVSGEVAVAMAKGLLNDGADVAVSVTGYASQTPDPTEQAGLCYIGIATKYGANAYKNHFDGDRNAVRKQATNMALFLALDALKTII